MSTGSVIGDAASVAAAIGAADSFVVVGHVGPDGDALGSMLGLARAGTAAGRSTWATFGEPFVVPRQMTYLRDDNLVSTSQVPDTFDVLVVVDCGDRSRLGSAAELVDRAGKVVVIDHHRSNSGFGDVAWIDPDAAATAEMVHDVLTILEWPITGDVATALYTGIVTDTGRFQYSSTSPHTHRVAADLLDRGVSPDAIGQELFEKTPFGYLTLAGAVLSRAAFDTDLAMVWSTLRIADLEAAGIAYEDADGLIDLVRVAEDAEIACLLREVGERRTKGSLRSRGTVDVSAAAVRLGGGGHHNAAGFTLDVPIDEAIDQVREALR